MYIALSTYYARYKVGGVFIQQLEATYVLNNKLSLNGFNITILV